LIELVLIGLVAGFLAGISPCILPVLPVVLVGGATGPGTDAQGTPDAHPRRAGIARSVAVVAGLALSFSVLILIGSEIISLLHLPSDSLRDAGIALLIIVGLGYLIPPLGALLERPFARITSRPAFRPTISPSPDASWGRLPIGTRLHRELAG
jgi:cytochrome c biogenesis protein CcdA